MKRFDVVEPWPIDTAANAKYGVRLRLCALHMLDAATAWS
jgi:hypothetical protein